MSITLQQLQSATLDQIKSDPELGRAVATAYGSPEVYNYWISGARSFDADKAYAVSNIQSNLRPLSQLADTFGNWNNPSNPTDQKAALQKRTEAIAEAKHVQQILGERYGIDATTLPEYQNLVTKLGGLGATPGAGAETSEQASARQRTEAGFDPITGQAVGPAGSTTPGGGLQMNYDQALSDIYEQRPDLQALYGSDGQALNPDDPNVAGIPSILDWAEKYGTQEYPNLQGFTSAGYTSGAQSGAGAGAGGTPGAPGSPLSPALQEIANAFDPSEINPNIELTPEVLKQFLDEAVKRVHPYYASQIANIREGLNSNIDSLQKQYELEKQGQEAQFRSGLDSSREAAAGAGTAFSGGRNAGEVEQAAGAQRNLDSLGLATSDKIGDQLRQAQSQIGSRNISDLGVPSIGVPTASTAGVGSFGAGRTISSFTPNQTTGSLEYNRNEDTDKIKNLLQQQYIDQVSRTGNRTLSFA